LSILGAAGSKDKIIIEEIKSKSGEKNFRQYEKGKFLGKVLTKI